MPRIVDDWVEAQKARWTSHPAPASAGINCFRQNGVLVLRNITRG